MRSFCPSRLLFGAALCGTLLAPCLARADAFSPIPVGDPIYRQLDGLSLMGDGKQQKTASNMTRYEAALQVARAANIATARPDALSRSGWRNLRDLTTSLKAELRQLGVNVDDVLEASARQLDAPVKATLPAPATPRPSKNRPNSAPSAPSFLNGSPSPATPNLTRNSLQTSLTIPFLGRVRTEAAGLALARESQDPLSDNRLGLGLSNTQFAGKDATISTNVGSWLRVSAQASQRQLNLGPDRAPAFNAPIFNGASQAQGFGGGVEVSPISGLRVSTDIEHLSTDAGIKGTRVGGGVGLSAWQNKLTLSAHMSRLQPEDRAQLAARATEFNLGLNVTQRLSFNVLYQNLFSAQSETSRLAGGLNFSF